MVTLYRDDEGDVLIKDKMLFDEDYVKAENEVKNLSPENFHDSRRASGECKCTACGKFYWQHPKLWPELFLHKICDGSYVKL